ncbi:tail fiber domain-containing protein [Aequorivita todarodis]|uniref:tail fiber domain-containing protein n=1 Tax=Aequorivita todarodis TaxID=2036821 RepID=UPI002350BE10|nr:tail fiber domain-containing protein [Aequorivita todarodis]MDC8000482.1 tail fiber domain-containing protein [Aequorivita todarodis]
MKYALFLLVLLFGIPSFSQVGIGTTSPNAQLDIRSSSQTLPSNNDGILIPKVNNFPGTPPTAAQDGMMVFATGSGIPLKGFYYWNNATTSWIPISGAKKIDDLSDGKSDSSGSSIFLGMGAGVNDASTTNRNIGVGLNALNRNTNGTNNTAIGYQTLNNNQSGNSNTAVGSQSLRANTGIISNTGSYNTATGSQTLKDNTVGSYNTATGFSALNRNVGGGFNTAVGYLTLFSNTGGNYNTAVGNGALNLLAGGSKNVAIGATAGANLTSGAGNILIGSDSGGTGNSYSYNDRLYIENSNSDTPLIGGDFATDRVGVNRPIGLLTNTFEVGGEASKASAGDWLANSDRRLKKNIHALDGSTALEKISRMNGVSYEWNDTQTGVPRPKGIQYGFIAQELMDVFPEKVVKDKQGFYQTAYGTYDAFYVQAIKELKQELDKKEARITELENKVNQFQAYKAENEKIENLENRLKKLEVLLINKTVSKD